MTGFSRGCERARSSPRCAVAVAVRMPMLTPSTKRAVRSPGTSFQNRNTTAERAERSTAMIDMRRRPAQSLR